MYTTDPKHDINNDNQSQAHPGNSRNKIVASESTQLPCARIVDISVNRNDDVFGQLLNTRKHPNIPHDHNPIRRYGV